MEGSGSMISSVTSLTEPIMKHLSTMEQEFYFAYQDLDLVSKQMYHYFISPFAYYQQYDHCFSHFGIAVANQQDELFIKCYEIGLMASTFYLLYHKNPKHTYERIRCDQLEKMNMVDAVQTFYQDPIFAKDMILSFVKSDFFSEDEIEQKKQSVNSKTTRTLTQLYPLYPMDRSIREYNKIKKL